MNTEYSSTLMNLILSANVKGLTSLIKNIYDEENEKLATYNANNTILAALFKAGFENTEEYTNLANDNSELDKELTLLTDTRHKAIEALKVFNK